MPKEVFDFGFGAALPGSVGLVSLIAIEVHLS
jgi:hypothetical protein